MPLSRLIDEKFGVRTRTVEDPIRTSVGTTAVLIFNNNPGRLAWTIVNTHATQTLHLALTNGVTMLKGVRLDPAGGFASEIWDEDFEETGWAVWGIASGDDTTIYSKEVVEY